jgi:hypothetical protein
LLTRAFTFSTTSRNTCSTTRYKLLQLHRAARKQARGRGPHLVLLVLEALSPPAHGARDCGRDGGGLLFHAADAEQLGDIELLLQDVAVRRGVRGGARRSQQNERDRETERERGGRVGERKWGMHVLSISGDVFWGYPKSTISSRS